MKLFEVTSTMLYHSTGDVEAMEILKSGKLNPSYDGVDDEKNIHSFISTSTNPKTLYYHGWPGSGNIQFVFDSNALLSLGYKIEPVDRFDEMRIMLPANQKSLPLNNKTVSHIIIDSSSRHKRYFKGWQSNVGDYASDQDWDNLYKNELNPKNELLGKNNPFGIIKILAQKRNIDVVDNR